MQTMPCRPGDGTVGLCRRALHISPPPKRFMFLVFLVSNILGLPNIGGVMTKPKTDKERERVYRQKYGLSESEARGTKTEADMKRVADTKRNESRKSESRSSSR
jgi:hypothetical protein